MCIYLHKCDKCNKKFPLAVGKTNFLCNNCHKKQKTYHSKGAIDTNPKTAITFSAEADGTCKKVT